MVKEENKQDNFWNSEWNLQFKAKPGKCLARLYSEKCQRELEKKYLTESNSILKTGIYVDCKDIKEEDSGDYNRISKEARYKFLHAFKVNNSTILEQGKYSFTKFQYLDNLFDVKITLKTPKGFLSKIKHHNLEKELDKIIQNNN